VVSPSWGGRRTLAPADAGPDKTYSGSVFIAKRFLIRTQAKVRLPMAMVMHGIDGTPCGVRWISRLLAYKGFVVIDAYRLPTTNQTDHDNGVLQTTLHMNAMHSAVKFLRSNANPYRSYVNRKRVVLAGHSLGASALSVLQSQIANVQTVIGLDNLKAFGTGDLGSALECDAPAMPVTPKVPALGMSSDHACNTLGAPPTPSNQPPACAVPFTGSPPYCDPELKKPAYNLWHNATPTPIASMELVMSGFSHPDFSESGTNAQLQRVAYYMLNWLDRFEFGHASANAKLTTQTPVIAGHPVARAAILSKVFNSAVFIPGAIDCPVLAGPVLPATPCS